MADNITINAEENSKANIIIKYKTTTAHVKAFHNGACNVNIKKGAHIQVTILNLLNDISENFYSMNNTVYEDANLEYIIADFGGSKTISNFVFVFFKNSIKLTFSTT